MTAAPTPSETTASPETSTAGKSAKAGPDLSQANARARRWRRALAAELGYDPGASLDEPRRMLALLRVFGATKRLADLCMKYPRAAAVALMEGPGPVLVEAARDLSDLDGGIGGGEALYGALAPIKARADIAVGIAEIQGGFSAADAAAARADLAERLIECALAWLLRGAVNRGELAIEADDGVAKGVFALAGGDAAHEDLTPNGPLELVVVYDPDAMALSKDSAVKRMAERAFVRIGAELRETFEGKSGDHAIFTLRTPLGDGVNGQGFVESKARLTADAENPENTRITNWLATTRLIGGDRTAGGAFLESIEAIVWPTDRPISTATDVNQNSDDPRAPFQAVANTLRRTLGAQRPIFRTASTRETLEMAGTSGILSQGLAARLAAGLNLAAGIVSRAQMIHGGLVLGPTSPDERTALATLLRFNDADTLDVVLKGAHADAANAATHLAEGPHADFLPYRNPTANADIDDDDDGEKLQDLGFLSGAELTQDVDAWAALCGDAEAKRFAEIAPGLLTAFGETQYPDDAARLFDQFVRTLNERDTPLKDIAENDKLQNAITNAFGMFGAAVEPLTQDGALCEQLIDDRGDETPTTGGEFVNRYPIPKDASLEQTKAWRTQNIARVALFAAGGDMCFNAAADALAAIQETTIASAFQAVAAEKKAEGLTLFTYDGAARGVPGYGAPIGFVSEEDNPFAEDAARAVVDALSGLGEGPFVFSPDVSHRPGGAGGALAPTVKQFKSYIQSEAVASDTMLLARGRVVAGPDKMTTKAIRTAVSNPRRADVLFRDLDRARTQRIRRDRSDSLWDFDWIEGGIQDTNLIISTLIYRHAAAQPAVQTADAAEALDLLTRAGLISAEVSGTLKASLSFWTRLAVLRAFSGWAGPKRDPVRKRFATLIARSAEVEHFAAVHPLMRGYADEVSRLYAQLVLGRPSLGLVANV
ncbi:MAG: hypothetical protein AAF224_13915 [Pseudomonadota bacterium]